MTDNHFFEATYHVADGFVGGDRPHYFTISPSDLEDGMTDGDLSKLFEDLMLDHFAANIWPESDDYGSFISWARQQLGARGGGTND